MTSLALAGPTACHKSDFAPALAERINGEIVSVDSGAVYREMDIGAAKPDTNIRRQIPHHLIDVCAPNESFNAGMFCRLATEAAADIVLRGKTPLFVGGTMMYFHALTRGLHDIPTPDEESRESVRLDMQKHGAKVMHKRLSELDSALAAKIAPSDSQRIARALEVALSAKKPMSAILSEPKPKPSLSVRFVLLMPDSRDILRESIAARLRQMFVRGLTAETETVIKKYKLTPSSQSLRMAGYKQAAAFLRGDYDEDEMQKRAYHATCQLAKRQITWLKRWSPPLANIDPFANDAKKKVLAAADMFNSERKESSHRR